MRAAPVAAMLIASFAMGSCTTRRGVLIGAGIGASTAAFGGFLSLASADTLGGCTNCNAGEESVIFQRMGGAVLLGLGGAILLGALLNFSSLAAKDNDEAEREQAVAPHDEESTSERRRADAWMLTKEAEAASRSGQCETVRKLGDQVLDLDAEFHSAVFLSDAGIVRCFVQTAIPPTVPAAAPQPQAPAAPAAP